MLHTAVQHYIVLVLPAEPLVKHYGENQAHVHPLRLAGLQLGPCSILPGILLSLVFAVGTHLPFSFSLVWISHLGLKSNSSHIDLSGCPTLSYSWFADMHTDVRRNILPPHICVHRRWLLRQLHRQHRHGASRAEACYTDQWAFHGSRLRLDGHCTFHFLTAARKVNISFCRSQPCSLAYRFLTGCGAGIGLCTGPIFLAEIAPSNIRGSVGRISGFH